MACLLELPHEVLHSILAHVEPHELAIISKSCQDLNRFIKDNRLLHKEIYLDNWDRPVYDIDDCDVPWEDELQKVVRFKKLLASRDSELKRSSLNFLSSTTVSLLQAATKINEMSRNLTTLLEMYQMPSNVHTLICGSSLFARANGDSVPHACAAAQEAWQLSAKLHCLYGTPIQNAGKLEIVPLHIFARARVYDLRRYTKKSFWGPFCNDRSLRVDWEKMEAIMILVDYNFKLFQENIDTKLHSSWRKPFYGATPNSYAPQFAPGPSTGALTDLDTQDPYNITGTWFRIVCFLDYSELFSYNFSGGPPALEQDREPLDTEEATRLIIMKLRLTQLEPPGEDDGQALPVAHFRGTSRSLHSSWDPNANSDIRGTVRLTKEGEVRWTTFSIYNGEERWRSEGIQVGGPNSARGVLGSWFDKDYDRHGPAGPTAFWKVHNGAGECKATYAAA